MSYTIHPFAKIQGLTVDTIREYERKGVVTPMQGSNGYRYFSDYDVRAVSTCKLYCSFGFTISQARDLLHSKCPQLLANSFNEQINTLEYEIKILNNRKKRLNNHIQYLSCIEENKAITVKLPISFNFLHAQNNKYEKSYEVSEQLSAWVKHMPITYYTYIIEQSSMNQNDVFDYWMAFTCDKEDAIELQLPTRYQVCESPSVECVMIIMSKYDDELLESRHIQPAYDSFLNMGYKLVHDISLLYLSSELKGNRTINHHAVFFPYNFL